MTLLGLGSDDHVGCGNVWVPEFDCVGLLFTATTNSELMFAMLKRWSTNSNSFFYQPISNEDDTQVQ